MSNEQKLMEAFNSNMHELGNYIEIGSQTDYIIFLSTATTVFLKGILAVKKEVNFFLLNGAPGIFEIALMNYLETKMDKEAAFVLTDKVMTSMEFSSNGVNMRNVMNNIDTVMAKEKTLYFNVVYQAYAGKTLSSAGTTLFSINGPCFLPIVFEEKMKTEKGDNLSFLPIYWEQLSKSQFDWATEATKNY